MNIAMIQHEACIRNIKYAVALRRQGHKVHLVCSNKVDRYGHLNDFYDTVDYRNRHNLILSISDGILLYFNEKDSKNLPYANWSKMNLKNRYIKTTGNRYVHLKYFSTYCFMGFSSATILYPEFTHYMGTIQGARNINEK